MNEKDLIKYLKIKVNQFQTMRKQFLTVPEKEFVNEIDFIRNVASELRFASKIDRDEISIWYDKFANLCHFEKNKAVVWLVWPALFDSEGEIIR